MRAIKPLKLALCGAAMTLALGAVAQPTNPADYVQVTADPTLQTTGYGLTLIVIPDPAYSPGFVQPTNTGVNPTSRFTWTVGGTAGAPTNNNWVEITAAQLAPVGGTLTVGVVESYLACTDATGVTHTITTVGAPTADISSTAPSANWTLVGPNLWVTCVAGETATITVTFAEPGVTGPLANYTYGLTESVRTFDAAGTPSAPTVTTPVTPNLGAMVASPATWTTPPLNLVGGLRTEYVFELAPSSIGSQISRLSQFRANPAAAFAYYTGATTTLTFIVNLAPVTGPIFHIPNTFLP